MVDIERRQSRESSAHDVRKAPSQREGLFFGTQNHRGPKVDFLLTLLGVAKRGVREGGCTGYYVKNGGRDDKEAAFRA